MKNSKDVERLYQNYVRYRSGDKSALDEIFMEVGKNVNETSRIVELEEEYKLSHTDNILDVGLVQDEIEYRRNKRKLKVIFSFPCLNHMARKAKYYYSRKHIFTGYENGKKVDARGYKKYHEGEYDTFDLEGEMQEILIKLFQGRLSGSSVNITDGVTLLQNIKYYLTKEMENSNKFLWRNVPETYTDVKNGEEISYFDQHSKLTWIQSENKISRVLPYADYLEWLKRNDVLKLFKENACDIKAIIETIMNCKETFETNKEGNIESGPGMCLVTQKMLHEIIKYRHKINIEQENISKDLELIERRLLNHLFYSLNFRIGKAESGKIYEKESERFLYELESKAFIKIFSSISCEIYDKSIKFINSNDFDDYFRIIKKYEDTVTDIVSLEKGKKKYDMVNLISEKDNDLVNDKREALLTIAKTVIAYYQNQEEEYETNELGNYKPGKLVNWEKGYWEAELKGEFLNIKFWTNKNVKKPILHSINKEKLMVYCGYMNYYFCNVENKICYRVPKDRRIISRANKNHEIFICNVS